MAHGRVLAGRYRLDEQLETSPDGSVWRAKDSTLDRRVVLRVLRPNHPFAADVGDAARRAALIDDSRLVRVLDVGLDDGLQYVVMEHVEGDTLEALVGRSPLPAPVVRRIVGEAAESLARAAGRGLHHLRLTPRSLVVRPDGSVKVLGIAVEAAAAGLEPDHAATASRVDAVALTALVYAGLTGRWPLGDAGFPPAPRAGAGPVPPGDLAQNVPNDLDTMCVVTLGRHNDGPRTPAELAQALAPWPSAEEAPVRSLGTSAGGGAVAAGEKPAPGQTKSAAGTDDKQPPAPTALPRRPSPARPAGPPPAKALPPAAARPPAANRPVVALPPAAGRPPAAKPPGAQPPSAQPAAQPPAAAAKSAEAKPAATQRPAAAAQPAGPSATAKPSAAAQAIGGSVRARAGGQASPDGPGNGPAPANALFTPGVAAPDAPSPQATQATQATQSAEHAAQATATVTPKEQLAIRPAPTTSPPAARPAPASSGPQPVQRPVVRTPDQGRPPPRTGDKRSSQNGPGRRHDTGEQLLPWADRWTAADAKPEHHHLDPTGPFPLVIPPEQPPREQTRFVIVAVFVMMILGLVLAVISIRDVFGTDSEPVFSEPQFSPSATTTPSPSASASGAPSAAPTAPAAGTIPVVAAIKALDPEGDRDEDTASSPRAVDGDSSTTWRSERYKSAEFGGLKGGVGLSLRLRVPAAVTSVSFDMVGAGGEVELRTGDTPDDIEETELAATSAMAGGTVTLKPSAPVRAKYVILWFTELPTTSNGFRIEVSEVRVQ